MILNNRQILCHILGGLLLCASLAGCATAPGAQAELPQLQQKAPACEAGCEEEESDNRYQYYLGMLSVFLLG